MSSLLKSCLFILILILSISFVASADQKEKTLIALYMVGSDLESLDGSASADIQEILSGIGYPNASVDIIVGYGGSRKMGWNGMTIVTSDDLKRDAEDGRIGNEPAYQYRNDLVNMGSPEGVRIFFQNIKGLEDYKRKILIFWDHGANVGGIGFDENYDWDSLDLKELRTTLQDAGIHWDMIGMDACLMGSYEVARSVEGIADYLLVSEDIEPGHGWNYTTPVSAIYADSNISIPEFGKILIDEYLDNPYHEPDKKTLSLIDLNKIPAIEMALSQVSVNLNSSIKDFKTYNGVGVSLSGSERYGYDPQTDQEQTIDLSDFSSHLDELISQNRSAFGDLRSAIDDAVLYQRNDGTKPGSKGVSIFSPRTKPVEEFIKVSESIPMNKDWDQFIRQYLTYIKQDKSKPVIVDLGEGRFRITDEQGLAYVRVDTDWMPDITNWSHMYGLKSEPVYPSEPDIYIPNPDDQTFYLKDTSSGIQVPFYHSYIGVNSEGGENYFGYVQVNRSGRVRDAVINPVRNISTGEISFSLLPYDLQEDGLMIFEKSALTLKSGDIITPKIVERFLIPNNPSWRYTPYTPLPVTGTIEIVRDRLPYGSYHSTLTVSDYNGNFDMSIIGTIRFPNNSSVTTSTP